MSAARRPGPPAAPAPDSGVTWPPCVREPAFCAGGPWASDARRLAGDPLGGQHPLCPSSLRVGRTHLVLLLLLLLLSLRAHDASLLFSALLSAPRTVPGRGPVHAW